MPQISKKATIGCKIMREEVPTAKLVARQLGYKSLSSWLETIFRREYSKALAEIVSSGSTQNEPIQPPTATA